MIQFIYNISIYIFIKQTLFFVTYRYYPEIYKTLTIRPDNLYVIIKVEHLKFLYNKLKNEFLFIKNRIVKYYNIKRMKKLSFKKKDKMYLFYKNIIIKRPNDKLNFKKFESFIIICKISEYNYKLSLFKTMQIHSIFYISLFEFILESTEIQKRRIEVVFY